MSKLHPKWPVIVKLAKSMGVTDWTLDKWRQRGVPAKMHVPLILASKGKITAKDFAEQPEAAE